MQCQQCKKNIPRAHAIRAIWHKKNKQLDLCPVCFAGFYKMDVKDNEMTNNDLKKTGLYQSGMDVLDVKSYLEKWSKNLQSHL